VSGVVAGVAVSAAPLPVSVPGAPVSVGAEVSVPVDVSVGAGSLLAPVSPVWPVEARARARRKEVMHVSSTRQDHA
jgi:hypothetical protein